MTSSTGSNTSPTWRSAVEVGLGGAAGGGFGREVFVRPVAVSCAVSAAPRDVPALRRAAMSRTTGRRLVCCLAQPMAAWPAGVLAAHWMPLPMPQPAAPPTMPHSVPGDEPGGVDPLVHQLPGGSP